MKEIRNNIIKRTVLWMSMFSVLLYSTRVCGITNLIVQAAEKDAPESDFVIEENRNIQSTDKKDNYIVVTEDSQTAKEIEKKYGEANTIGEKSKHDMQKESVAVCKMTGSQAQTLQERDDILRVEKDSTIKANGKRHKRQVVKMNQSKLKKEWNMAMIRRDVNDTVSTKDKVKVAVIDSGVDFGNDVELKGFIDLVPGYEECLPYYTDITGHGSAVAGIIAAEKNGKGITGINTNVELYSARVLDENNSAPTSRVIEAIYWAIDHNVNIINMSFGMKEDSQALHNAIKDAYNAGILLIAAAGNTSQVEYPAAYGEVVAVGAVDSDGVVCDNSAKGDEIELVAPGEKIASTGAFCGELVCSGTSMAAPHVTGLASLLWQKDMNMSSDFVRSLLKASANNYGDEKSYGYGLIDCKYAEQIYDSFKEEYLQSATVSNVEKYNNTAVVTTLDNNTYVEGSWDTMIHKELVSTSRLSSADVNTIKEGIVYPDKKGGVLEKMSVNPGFHGNGEKGNYVLNAIYLSYLAKNWKIQNASEIFPSDIYNRYKSNFDDMYKKLNQCKGDIKNKYFMWGIALHSLTDSYSHNSFVKPPSSGTWVYLVHDNDERKNKSGYEVGVDNPYIARGRFDSAQTSANIALAELCNGNAWTFRVYEHRGYFQSYYSREIDGFPKYDWEFKMNKLFYYAKEVDYGANYSEILKRATYGTVK